jgi:hypothetical protein
VTKKPIFWLAAYVFITGIFMSFDAPAQSVANFYKSKPLTIVVGFTTGGGYDTYARVLARHYTRHIPVRRPLSSRTCRVAAAWPPCAISTPRLRKTVA